MKKNGGEKTTYSTFNKIKTIKNFRKYCQIVIRKINYTNRFANDHGNLEESYYQVI